ncbi:response regulator [Burkholderia sp. JPY481]
MDVAHPPSATGKRTASPARIAAALSASGYGTQFAVGVPAALAAMAAWMPEIALLDINMPGTDGFRFARELRHDARTQHLVLLAFTAYDEITIRAKGIAAGFDGYCQKGAAPDLLFVWPGRESSREPFSAVKRIPNANHRIKRGKPSDKRPLSQQPLIRQPEPRSGAFFQIRLQVQKFCVHVGTLLGKGHPNTRIDRGVPRVRCLAGSEAVQFDDA